MLFAVLRNKAEPEWCTGKMLHTHSALQSWEYPKRNQENAGNRAGGRGTHKKMNILKEFETPSPVCVQMTPRQ